jgi:hypothetical protein
MRILRVVRGRVLPCGCVIGAYETYSGGTVEIVDERGALCRDSSHRAGRSLAREGVPPAAASRARHTREHRL